MSSKKYYWLKLNENFFERDDIRVIENMPNGVLYINFYLKLLLKSIKTEGSLKFREVIPYTPEMLASVTNTDIDTVRVATKLFVDLNMMEMWDDGTIFMVETQNMIGSESSSAERVRRHREKKKLEEEKQLMLQCNDDETKSNTEKEIELDIDIEKEIDKENNKGESEETLSVKDKNQVVDLWNEVANQYGLNQVRLLKAGTTRYNMLKARIDEYSLEEILEAINNIKSSPFLQGKNDRGWTIDFEWFVRPNNFPKVLEGNYIYEKKEEPRKTNGIKPLTGPGERIGPKFSTHIRGEVPTRNGC